MKSTLTFFLLVIGLAGCSTLKSQLDEVHLIWTYSNPIESAKTPEGFVVTPQEIKEVVPLTKFAWNIYADRKNYYLSPALQKISSKTGDNSHLAKENGIKIEGVTRDTFDKIKDDIDVSGTRFISPERLRELTEN